MSCGETGDDRRLSRCVLHNKSSGCGLNTEEVMRAGRCGRSSLAALGFFFLPSNVLASAQSFRSCQRLVTERPTPVEICRLCSGILIGAAHPPSSLSGSPRALTPAIHTGELLLFPWPCKRHTHTHTFSRPGSTLLNLLHSIQHGSAAERDSRKAAVKLFFWVTTQIDKSSLNFRSINYQYMLINMQTWD